MKIIVRGIPRICGRVEGEVRGYDSSADRRRAIEMLKKRGYDSFTTFVDVQSDFTLMFGKYLR